jgi:sarcosine oxidase subunit beta
VIIGAGVVGCSLAHALARRGSGAILVLERGAIGQGATAACAGGVRAQFATEINVRIGMEAKRLFAHFRQETGQDAGFRQIGYLFLLQTMDELALFEEAVRLQQRCGVEDVRELSPNAARELVPGLETGDLCGAVYCPSDGIAGPHDVTYGYASAARRLGVQIVEDAAVEEIVFDGTSVAGVRTLGREVRARVAVICAGPWSGQVGKAAGLSIPIEPSRRNVFVSGPVERGTPSLPMTIDFHTSFYFHPEGEGVLFGMSDPEEPPGFETAVDWSLLPRIGEVARRRWPPLLEAGVQRAWAGLYELTPDSQPLIGPVSDRSGLWIAAGFSGHGFMMGPVVSGWLAEWMTAGKPPLDLQPFAPDRFRRGSSEPERAVV